ncbi:TraB/GumN family protein [Chitinophaga sancti]|uniref:TraB/GumN family protein n=1 Tax=Chitinophaga sancti TaxID=1004 RepID=UPI003F79CE60
MLTTLLGLLTTFLPLAQRDAPKDSSSLLWKISGHGLSKPSYLFGTIHMICSDDLPFSVSIGKAMKETKAFYTEFNLDDAEALKRISGEMIMPPDYSFKSLFTPEDYTLLRDYFLDSMGVTLETLDRMKPMVIISILLQHTVSCEHPVSCEQMLLDLAKGHGMSIHGLERAEDQVAIFDSIPDKEEAAALVKTVKTMASSREDYDELLKAYYSADINRLFDLVTKEEFIVRYKRVMLDNRNRNWIQVISKQIQQAPAFFACGVGHLGGKEGVIALLREEGYRVEPVIE